MASIRRSAGRCLLALLVASLIVPMEGLRPDPATVAAAAVARSEQADAAPPASPGTYRSTASAVTTPITSVTVAAPSGLTSGDVMLAGIVTRDEAAITTPGGWTLVRSDANGTALRQSVYVRVAGGSEPADYTWTLGEAVAGAGAGIVAYSGVDTTTPVDVQGGQTNSSSSSVTAPSVTTTVTNTRVVGFFATANDGTFSPPSGTTERTDLPIDGTIQAMSSIADVAQAASGASGSKVATASVSAVNIGALVALRPSGSIALRAASSAATIPTTTLTVDTPGSVEADDVLVAAISMRAPRDVTPPAGWSLVREDTSGTTIRQSIFVRTATGSEPADHTWTFAEPVSTAVGGIIAIEGLDPVSPVDVSGGQTNSSSTSITAPSITTTVADATLIGAFAVANDVTATPPGGMTERSMCCWWGPTSSPPAGPPRP